MENKLGTMPIGRLIVTMSVPMMISMFVQALYNMVDSMFVANISENALTAVTLAFPVQNVMHAIAVGTGVGVSALVSRSLGQRNGAAAQKAANVQIFLSACYWIFFLVVGILFTKMFFRMQTDIEEVIAYGEEYLSIVCIFSVGMFYGQNLEKLLVAVGFSGKSMISQASGAVINIILDPILIFGWWIFPEMGVRGAAIATVIGQSFAALLAFYFNLRINHQTRFDVKQMLPQRRVVSEIFSVAFPSMVTIGLPSVTGYIMNGILLSFSATATAVFGVWIKIQSFAFMPVFGMNNGTIPIYSYNYGARRYDRVRETLKKALMLGLSVTSAAMLLYEIIPGPLLYLFDASDYMLEIGIWAIRICSISLPIGAVCILVSTSVQLIDYSRYTLVINISRQLVLPVLVGWLLAMSGRLTYVWFFPLISECIAALIAVGLCLRVFRKFRREEAEEAARGKA